MNNGRLTTIDYKRSIHYLQHKTLANSRHKDSLTNYIKITQGRFTLPKGSHELFYCWLPSCNRGLTNLKYNGIQQDLTDEKEKLQRYAG
jgi:hypothetical protein